MLYLTLRKQIEEVREYAKDIEAYYLLYDELMRDRPGSLVEYLKRREALYYRLPRIEAITVPHDGTYLFNNFLAHTSISQDGFPLNARGANEYTKYRSELMQLFGKMEMKRDAELPRLLSPLHWIWALIQWILRLPIATLKIMGVNMVEFEKQFWGKFLLLVFVVALLFVGLKGFNLTIEQITNLIKALKGS